MWLVGEVRIMVRAVHSNYRMSTHLKKLMNDILYPFCSAIPAATTFADAPISVPLPTTNR